MEVPKSASLSIKDAKKLMPEVSPEIALSVAVSLTLELTQQEIDRQVSRERTRPYPHRRRGLEAGRMVPTGDPFRVWLPTDVLGQSGRPRLSHSFSFFRCLALQLLNRRSNLRVGI